jgi:signal transduction histidine kinase
MSARTGLLDPVSEQVETTLFRALAVLRVVVAGYAVVLNAVRWREFDHPAAGWTVVALIVVWTLFATWAYDSPALRGVLLLVVDVVVSAATLLSTPYVQSDAMLERHASTMPSFWVMASVLAWAVARGWLGGVPVAVLMSVLDLSVRSDLGGSTWGNIFLLLLAAGVVGYSVTLIREATEARAAAERLAAQLAERARLARAVHDGVLQVLALVQRRGRELGGEAAVLGGLAGEQEVALRALVQGQAGPASASAGPDGTVDLLEALSRCQSATVTVSAPAREVRLPGHEVAELVSVVRACLDNVVRHVGADARAWVLLEDLGGRVVVTVRDDGPGIAPGRLEQAEEEGRLGVSSSIRGRMSDLGGRAELVTGPGQGTEWELSLPLH